MLQPSPLSVGALFGGLANLQYGALMADRHHYVSQFHLRWFTDPASEKTRDPWLWVGDREQQNVSRHAPKNVGWFRGIFDGPGAFANRDLCLEEFHRSRSRPQLLVFFAPGFVYHKAGAGRSRWECFDTWRGRQPEACR